MSRTPPPSNKSEPILNLVLTPVLPLIFQHCARRARATFNEQRCPISNDGAVLSVRAGHGVIIATLLRVRKPLSDSEIDNFMRLIPIPAVATRHPQEGQGQLAYETYVEWRWEDTPTEVEQKEQTA